MILFSARIEHTVLRKLPRQEDLCEDWVNVCIVVELRNQWTTWKYIERTALRA